MNRTGATLIVAMSDPSNIYAIDDIKFITGYEVEPHVASEAAVKKALDRAYDSAGTMADFVMLDMVAEAVSGQKTPKEAAERAQKRAERYYKV